MLVRTYSGVIRGVETVKISIEVNVTQGIRFFIVGLADNAIRESQQRIESAMTTNGFGWPRFRVVINLAPADMRKEGTHFDLPMAIGILAATGQVDCSRLEDYLAMGELSLDGSILPVRGVLPMVMMARKEGIRGVIVPEKNAREASVVDGIELVAVSHLKEAVAFMGGGPVTEGQFNIRDTGTNPGCNGNDGEDFSEVNGQLAAKRAMLIAAAGGHHLLLIGSPGSGKSMMARRLPGILPAMSMEESLETTVIYSVAGKVGPGEGLITTRPFRAPHHSSSDIALVGGGSYPHPGEISLAHHGVLFLDELPEFRRHVLEVLRQPLEDRRIHVSRAHYRVTYPADFMLIAAMNPCPCGFYNCPGKECNCGPGIIRHYLSRISGPLLDRIDIHMEVAPVPFRELIIKSDTLTSESIHRQVMIARRIQQRRFEKTPHISSNARMSPAMRKEYCTLDREGYDLVRQSMERLGLSARAYDRILKLARTIADLDERKRILPSHVSEAITYRSLDRKDWAG